MANKYNAAASAAAPAAKPVIANPANMNNPKPQLTAATPSTLQQGNDNSPSGGNAMTQSESMTSRGLQPIRKTLESRNAASGLGWNDAAKTITMNGNDVFKPQYNVDGTTYASPADVDYLTQLAYAQRGDRLVPVRQYANESAAGIGVSWDDADKTVNVGGTTIRPTYINDGGISYAPQSQLDAALDAYKARTGVRMPETVLETYENKSGAARDRALQELLNRKSFDYDPKSDPLYQRYAAEKQRQADEAYRRVLNDNNSSVNTASGAVVSQAIAAKNAYLRDIAEQQLARENTAYSRYMDDYSRLRNNLNDVMTAGNDYYNKLYQQDYDSWARGRQGMLDQMEQEKYADQRADIAWERSWNDRLYELQAENSALQNLAAKYNNNMLRYNAETYPQERDYQLRGMDLANEGTSIANRTSQLGLDQTMSYMLGGGVTDEMPQAVRALQSAGYTPGADGIYAKNGVPYNWTRYDNDYTYRNALAQYKAANDAKMGLSY